MLPDVGINVIARGRHATENTYSPNLSPSVMGIPSSYRVHIWYGKTSMAGLQAGKGRMMINLVVRAQYINVTDTRRHSNRRPNAVRIRRQIWL